MKIWYQSMSRFETKWKSYPKYLRQILDQVKDPDTEIEVHGITKIGGFADQYRYLEYLETGEVMENVHTAMERGFDAFLIGNIADPGLRECREIANFPVLGLCETSLLHGLHDGREFLARDHQREIHAAHRRERGALRPEGAARGRQPHEGRPHPQSRRRVRERGRPARPHRPVPGRRQS